MEAELWKILLNLLNDLLASCVVFPALLAIIINDTYIEGGGDSVVPIRVRNNLKDIFN